MFLDIFASSATILSNLNDGTIIVISSFCIFGFLKLSISICFISLFENLFSSGKFCSKNFSTSGFTKMSAPSSAKLYLQFFLFLLQVSLSHLNSFCVHTFHAFHLAIQFLHCLCIDYNSKFFLEICFLVFQDKIILIFFLQPQIHRIEYSFLLVLYLIFLL